MNILNIEILQYAFMQRAFVAGILVAIIAPLIGTFLVTRRLSLVADTLSHVALTGVAIGLLTHVQPLITTILVTVLAGVVLEKLRSNNKLPGDALLALFLPGGLALAVVLVSLGGGANLNLLAYLFGSITTVQTSELGLIVGLGVATLITVRLGYRQLLYSAFDPDAARLSGVNVGRVNTILMLLTAVTVSLAMRIVGVLLVGALMVIPVVTATRMAKSFKQVMLISVGAAIIAVLVGLVAAYYLNLPAGAAIVLTSLAIFAISIF